MDVHQAQIARRGVTLRWTAASAAGWALAGMCLSVTRVLLGADPTALPPAIALGVLVAGLAVTGVLMPLPGAYVVRHVIPIGRWQAVSSIGWGCGLLFGFLILAALTASVPAVPFGSLRDVEAGSPTIAWTGWHTGMLIVATSGMVGATIAQVLRFRLSVGFVVAALFSAGMGAVAGWCWVQAVLPFRDLSPIIIVGMQYIFTGIVFGLGTGPAVGHIITGGNNE